MESFNHHSGWFAAKSMDGSGDGYFTAIAHARYLIRKIFRIVDDQAKRVGLDPLQHQALLQIYGLEHKPLMVNQVAERLDISPAFASRVVKGLETRGLVRRSQSTTDRRIALVTVTDAGRKMLGDIDRAVHVHVSYFQSQLRSADRLAALATFGFYVGIDGDSGVAHAIREATSEAVAEAEHQERAKGFMPNI